MTASRMQSLNTKDQTSTPNYYDVDMSFLAVLSHSPAQPFMLLKFIGDETIDHIEKKNIFHLASFAAGPCIIIAAAGRDTTGNIVHSLGHLPDQDFCDDFFQDLRQLMGQVNCFQFTLKLFAGNHNSLKFRQQILSTSPFQITDCQQNQSSEEDFYTNVFIGHHSIRYQAFKNNKLLAHDSFKLLPDIKKTQFPGFFDKKLLETDEVIRGYDKLAHVEWLKV